MKHFYIRDTESFLSALNLSVIKTFITVPDDFDYSTFVVELAEDMKLGNVSHPNSVIIQKYSSVLTPNGRHAMVRAALHATISNLIVNVNQVVHTQIATIDTSVWNMDEMMESKYIKESLRLAIQNCEKRDNKLIVKFPNLNIPEIVMDEEILYEDALKLTHAHLFEYYNSRIKGVIITPAKPKTPMVA